jgi:GntR family transcriptional regulator, transcriptional repressor for pyruvate dehydrogenase complex
VSVLISSSGGVGARSRRTFKPQKTAMLLAQRIVSEITDRGLAPGTMLPSEHEMLTEYGVARGTLREALRYLESQGILTIKPGPRGGPVVTAPDPRYFASTIALLLQVTDAPYRTVVEARQIVEPALAARAAEAAGAAEVAELEASLERMEASLDDLDAFLEENRAFHDLIADISGNQLFEHLLASLGWITDGTALGVDYPKRSRTQVLEVHRGIVAAIREGDGPLAETRMREHIGAYVAYLQRNYAAVLDQKLRWEDVLT